MLRSPLSYRGILKVPGLHIAYGSSVPLCGKVSSDMHQDICYPKNSPIEATNLTLINDDGSRVELIRDSILSFDIIAK